MFRPGTGEGGSWDTDTQEDSMIYIDKNTVVCLGGGGGAQDTVRHTHM